jgi:hypothetical protein
MDLQSVVHPMVFVAVLFFSVRPKVRHAVRHVSLVDIAVAGPGSVTLSPAP